MRKNALIFTFTIFFSTLSMDLFSQVQKGDSNIGLNTQISSLIGVGSPNANGLISLSYQYYFSNNISFGAGPFYRFSNTSLKNTSFDSESWNQTLGINTFANYSFLTPSAKALPYFGIQFTYQNTYLGTDTYPRGGGYIGTWQKLNNTALGVNAGLKFFFTERVNFDGNLSYTTVISTTVESEQGSLDITPEGGLLQFTIGLGIILGKRG